MRGGSQKPDGLLEQIIILISLQDQINRKDKAKLAETWHHKIAWDIKQKIDSKIVRDSMHFYWYKHGPYSEPIRETLHSLESRHILKKEQRGSQCFYMLQAKPSINNADSTIQQLSAVVKDTLARHDLYNLDAMLKEVYMQAPLKFQPIFRFEYLQDLAFYKELLFDAEHNENAMPAIKKKLMKSLYLAEANLPESPRFGGFKTLFSEYAGAIQTVNELYTSEEEKEFVFLSLQTANIIWDTFAYGLRIECHESYYDNRVPQWENDFEKAIMSMESSVTAFGDAVSKKAKNFTEREILPLDNDSQELLTAIIQEYQK